MSRCFLAAFATAIFAIAATALSDKAILPDSMSVNVPQHRAGSGSLEGSRQQRMAAQEKAIGAPQASNAQLLEKLDQLQRTVDELKTSNAELRESNMKLSTSNAELSRRIVDLDISDAELRQLVVECQSLLTYERKMSQGASTTSPEAVTSPLGTMSSPHATTTTSSPHPTRPGISAERRESLSKELVEAAREGNTPRVRQLVTEGADIEYVYGDTALHAATERCHLETMRALLELGAPLEASNNSGRTPLYLAIFSQREDCVKMLLSAGASVNVRERMDDTPLHYAALYGPPSIVKMLIDAGADRGAKDSYGKLPKFYAVDAAICALL